MIDSDNIQEDIVEEQENIKKPVQPFKQKQFSLLNILSSTKYNYDNEKEIVFQNYRPKDESFKVEKMNYFELVAATERKNQKKVLKNIKNFIFLEKNPLNIIPTKNNLDLKRNVAPRLKKLNKKTENAILELINEAIHKQKDTSKLAYVADKQFQKETKELQQDDNLSDEEEEERDNFNPS